MPVIRFTVVLSMLTLALAACGKPPATDEIEPQATGENSSEEKTVETAAETFALTRTPSPSGARVFFITPADGDTVSNPFVIEFGIEGMSVAKAGDEQPDSGHHHLLIDTDLPDPGLPIPASPNHVHFGDGSISTVLSLAPGPHSLRLMLGDHRHIPHDPPITSDPISITVE